MRRQSSVARLGYLSQIGLLLDSSYYFFLGVATSHKLGYFSVWEFWATFGLLFTKITFFCNFGKLLKGLFSRNITDKPQLFLEKWPKCLIKNTTFCGFCPCFLSGFWYKKISKIQIRYKYKLWLSVIDCYYVWFTILVSNSFTNYFMVIYWDSPAVWSAEPTVLGFTLSDNSFQ